MLPPHVPGSSLECCEPGCLAEQVQLCFLQSLFVGYAWLLVPIFQPVTREDFVWTGGVLCSLMKTFSGVFEGKLLKSEGLHTSSTFTAR